jgi:predicted phage-related endonuclease
MDVIGSKKGKFVYLVLDDRFYDEIEVNYDPDFAKKQRDHLIEWWNRYIIGDEIPTKVVADYEKSSPEQAIVEADEDAINAYENLVTIKGKIKDLTEHKETYEEILKEKIGDNTDLMHGIDVLATWRPSVKVSVSTKKLKEEQPELFLKYAEEQTSRRFLIKQPKNQ